MEKNVFWTELINQLKEQRVYVNGITVPYLIGAYSVAFQLTPKKELLEEVISILINSSSNTKPVLQHCGDIGEYVIGIATIEYCTLNYPNETVFLNEHNDKTLFIKDNAKHFGKTENELIENLWKRYQTPIESKKFSWRGKWEEFSEVEKSRIQKIINN